MVRHFVLLVLGTLGLLMFWGCDDETQTTVRPPCRFPREICDQACVDHARDTGNCGFCGNACGDDQICQDGLCVTSCGNGVTDCPDGCRDLNVDPMNCGACDNACLEGEVCRDGACNSLCGAEMLVCDGVCRDIASDPDNCGSCGHVCAAGEVCRFRACSSVCSSGLSECSGECHNLSADRNHCGACFRGCDAGEVCLDSRCTLVCPPEFTVCDNRCASIDRDPLNCGGCGSVCEEGQVCSEGDCLSTCGPGMSPCEGRCTDPRYDPGACGFCGISCSAPENGVPVCRTGICGFVCASGFEDCNEIPGDGCETAVSSDSENCGACDLRCEAGPHSTSVCRAGRCDVTCEDDTSLCHEGGSSVCVDLTTDPDNCGACADVCAEDESCREGECGIFGPTRDEVVAAGATEDAWLRDNPYGDKHDGGWVHSPRENVLYAIYGNDNSGQNVYRIDHIGHTSELVATLSYGRHGSHPVIDSEGRFVYFPPSQQTNQLERLDTMTYTVELLAPAPAIGTFVHCDWKNDRLWCVLDDTWLHAYNPATEVWNERIQNYSISQGMVVAHGSRASNDIYIWLTNESFWAYDTVTGDNRELARFPVDALLDGNGQIAYIPSADGSESGFIYAVSGCSGSPRLYSIYDNEWFGLSDSHDNGDCNGHATYDSTSRRLYVTDGSNRVWFYEYGP
jgi:hypothetical protein